MVYFWADLVYHMDCWEVINMSAIGNKEIFAENLRYYIEKSGKSQKQLAAIVDVARSTFNDWATAKKYPRIDKIEILANYFGIQKSDLIEERKEKPAMDDGASANRRALREFVEQVPEDKAEMILRVMRTIVESD